MSSWNMGLLGAVGVTLPSFELIQTVNVSSTQTSVTFSNIPNTYRHLQLRFVMRDGSSFSDSNTYMRLNGDTAANYANHNLWGTGASVVSGSGTSQNFINLGRIPTTSHTSGVFSPNIVDILDYTSTSKNKTIRALSGINSSFTDIQLRSGLWMNTAAITSITVLTSDSGPTTSSRFSLYGIRG